MFTHQINHVLYMTGNNRNAAAVMQYIYKYCIVTMFEQYIAHSKLSKATNIENIEHKTQL